MFSVVELFDNIYYINQAEAGDGEGKFNSIIDAMKVKDEFVFENEKYEVRIGGEGFDEYLSYIITGEELEEILYGDVFSDDVVNNKDLIYLKRYRANWPGYDKTTCDLAAADVFKDEVVNNKDVIYLTRHRANWLGYETLPVLPE